MSSENKHSRIEDFPFKFPSMNRTLNFKEDIKVGWDAVVAAVFQLVSTPINSLPFTPSIGFDLDDFLFRVTDSREMSDLENELSAKVQQITGNGNIQTVVNVSNQIVYIDIIYTKDAKEERLPIRIDRNDNSIKIRDIQVR